MPFRRCLIIAFVMSLLAGCATSGDWCASNRPVRPTGPTGRDVATMSGGTARQILEHNQMGQKTYGWQP